MCVSCAISFLQNEFDVIITDSSDPVGPAESLFGQSYYELLRDSLNDTGVLASQGEVFSSAKTSAHSAFYVFNCRVLSTASIKVSVRGWTLL